MYHRFNPNKNARKKTFHKSLGHQELLTAIKNVEVIKKDKPAAKEEVIVANDFTSFGLASQILTNISHKGYGVPTPIQDQAIPAILSGRDVIGIANTGTGKTAAFLIPLVNKVFHNKSERVLIVAPTRELAVQIHDEFRSVAKGLGMRIVLCIGGTSLGRQKAELKQYPHFVIGTPGRIKDLIEERSLQLYKFKNVVLDEADRMVDIGFITDITYFISLLPKDRQSLFFSATISPKVKEILQQFVINPVTVSVKQQDTAENIVQEIVKVGNGFTKIETLHNLLVQDGFDKVLIFGRTKWGVQKLTNELVKRGFKAAVIHGNKNQNQRQRAIQMFKNNQIQVLLATDVASRGLDIQGVTHVINYEMPASMEDYIHRIGRTGRANQKGIALTFVE